MERQYIHPAELELRRDSDFLRSENMVGKGSPVRNALTERESIVRKLESIENSLGYEKPSIPRRCEF
ncbi:hypothetical protein [Sporosarcina ureae]|uniref:Uncharacterized protein n=1 Tax=Sporosarcina ureae TaxID=1571 RepID=A0ABM6JWK2_SPOUR|nr:hypothetical protein [Sporosarcina ureae]ARF14474.1 hypothetical protein SporoS204_10155 [Sporosarcina ureae]